MPMKDDDPNGSRYRAFLAEFAEESKRGLIAVTECAADIAEKAAVKELTAIKREGPLGKYRTKHLSEDVKRYKKGQKIQIGGGPETAGLWHIVNDGTYRSKAYHFMEKVINEVNSRSDEAWEAGRKELED